jgi:hypothetical protein
MLRIIALLLASTAYCQAETFLCSGKLKKHGNSEPLTAAVVVDGTSIIWGGARADLLCDETGKDTNCDFMAVANKGGLLYSFRGYIDRVTGRAHIREETAGSEAADLDILCGSVKMLLCDPRDGACDRRLF